MRMKENMRTTSIARKINRAWVGKQLFIYFWMDIFVAAMILAGWCYRVEVQHLGEFRFVRQERAFYGNQRLQDIVYRVRDFDGNIWQENVWWLLKMLLVGLGIVGTLQILSLLHSIFYGSRFVRYHLHPLNEMAKKAEELSSIAFDESKYHLLEDAISNVNPGVGDEHLQIGDKDLDGLELAVNNLIDRMRESYRQQSRFVSDASHELRTPISVIQGYANMLDRWGKEDETILEEGIEAIKHESEHMSTLVEQLLFLARSDSGRHQMGEQDVSFSEIVHEVYEENVMIDKKHRYKIKEPKEPVEVTVLGDPAMLKQTLRILTDNARKYTEEKDEIFFSYGIGQNDGNEECFFYVQDAGSGMREADVTHIFERFYRSDAARNSSRGGSGLGLSIAKWIIDKHCGHFEILSREGIGTRMIVWLPKKPLI